MKTLVQQIKTSVLIIAVFAVLLCGVYPALIGAGAQLFFRERANGSWIVDHDGQVRGSTLIAQAFTDYGYFHPRPSAAGAGFDAMNSSGTNLGPTSKKLRDQIRAAIATYRRENNIPAGVPIPADAVTSSGSGLDPHISLANADLQARRVARARGLSLARTRELIVACTDRRELGIFGEPGVNVMKLNWTLDQLPQDRFRSFAPEHTSQETK